MVSIDASESDPKSQPPKKRGTKPKQQARQHAMNGHHNNYNNGHDSLGMGRPAKQLTDEELHAQLKRKEQEAAIAQQEVQQLIRACEERSEAKRLEREVEALRQQSTACQDELEDVHRRLQAAESHEKNMLAAFEEERQQMQIKYQRLNSEWAEEMDVTRSQAQQAVLAAQAGLEELQGGLGAREADLAALQAETQAARTTEMALREEVQQAMDVLGEWQHYGRSRNAQFEDLVTVCTGKDGEIVNLRRQLEGAGVKPWTPPSASQAGAGHLQHPVSPHGSPGMLPPPALQQGFPGMPGHSAPMHQQQQHSQYMLHAQQLQHQQVQHAQQQQPVMGHDSGPGPQPSQAAEHLTGVLLQLLPHGEDNAISVTQSFEQTAQEHFPAVWEVLRHQQCGNLATFMASRPMVFHRRAADGLFYRLVLLQGDDPHVLQLPSPEAYPARQGQQGQSLKPRDCSPISIRDATVAPPLAGVSAAAIQRPMPPGAPHQGLQQNPLSQQQQQQRPQQVQEPPQQASHPNGQPPPASGGPVPQPQQQLPPQEHQVRLSAPAAVARAPPAPGPRPVKPVYVVPPYLGAAKHQEELRVKQAQTVATAAAAGTQQPAAPALGADTSVPPLHDVSSQGSGVLVMPRSQSSSGVGGSGESHTSIAGDPGAGRGGGRGVRRNSGRLSPHNRDSYPSSESSREAKGAQVCAPGTEIGAAGAPYKRKQQSRRGGSGGGGGGGQSRQQPASSA